MTEPFDLLFVCTGNICRSPVAERLATRWAADAGRAPEALQVGSAGLQAAEGRPMDPRSAAALEELGGDPSGFRSRPLTADIAVDADLVFTMTRRQRRSVLEMTPRALRRTFTLTEAATLLQHADLTGLAGMPLGERAASLALRLDAARALSPSADTHDIPDPIDSRASVHRQVARTIATSLRPLADVLFGTAFTKQPVDAEA